MVASGWWWQVGGGWRVVAVVVVESPVFDVFPVTIPAAGGFLGSTSALRKRSFAHLSAFPISISTLHKLQNGGFLGQKKNQSLNESTSSLCFT
ncbi:hypothetical protein LOK49_LG03G03620 [Camellia lanceoleosa]|uniref:Uncharacterized protein n=1 Tax=Camellia lanceoleosa TaxID=1840588 RepID=A0ACC0IEJ8_9ERIC|nr:hypothetical protein LOK49_LG03G03620 [Camellia lanceoleosa]